MEIEIPAKLILRERGNGLKPIVKLRVAGENHVLYPDPEHITNYGNLIQAIALRVGREHPGHIKAEDDEDE